VPNLLKYVYDIDPTKPMGDSDRLGLPVSGVDTLTTPGTQYVTLTYQANPGVSGTSINVQTSSDLQSWTTVAPPDIFQTVGTASNGDPIMEIGVKASGQTKQFIRLNVTQP
jgi:hypothetical protein